MWLSMPRSLDIEKCHDFVVLGIFHFFVSDHAADDGFLSVLYAGFSCLLVEQEIRHALCDVAPPQAHVVLQRMAADIDAQHFFLECQLQLFGVLADVRHRDDIVLFAGRGGEGAAGGLWLF